MQFLCLQEVRERRQDHRGPGPEDGVTADEGLGVARKNELWH